MSIITISRGSYSHGKAIAEKVAKKLGYECISREVLLEASDEFNISEIKLLHALRDAPSIFDRFTYGKEKYIAYIQAALLKLFQKDKVVYHGFAGHFFVKDIPHVLKVRIIVDIEDRVEIVRKREGISRKEALHFIKKLDDQRKKWSKQLYSIDTWDSSLYDLIIHIEKITEKEAIEIICHTIIMEPFQTTAESQQAMNDLTLTAEVKAALIALKPDIEGFAKNGVVDIKTTELESKEKELVQNMKNIAERIPGIKDINFNVFPYIND